MGPPKCSRRLLALAAAIAVGALAPAAAGAREPGIPVPVAPGVPGQGRAWELVTPPDTVTFSILSGNRHATSQVGDKFLFSVIGAMPGAQASTLLSLGLSERGATGWTTEPLEYPGPNFLGLFDLFTQGPLALSPDFSASIWANRLPPGKEELGPVGLFRGGGPGQFTFLAKTDPGGRFVAASEDLQRVVFMSADHLLPADAGRSDEGRSIYELDGQTLRVVDVDDDGSLLSTCGSDVSKVASAVSRDAERIFLLSPAPPCPEPIRVYLREGGETTEISASHCTRPDCNPARRVDFVGATPDGSTAFLVTEQQLTNDDVDSAPDLYRYDVADGALSRVSSPRPSESPVGGASNDKEVQVAEDGSRVYFEFDGSLVSGLGDGLNSLYMADGQRVHYIASNPGRFRISRDGRYAVVETAAALDPQDTDSVTDLYRYDAATGTAVRLSAGALGGGNGPQPMTLSAITGDGQSVFFETAEQLLPGDRNEVKDVYVWTRGALDLISAGSGDLPAEFVEATPDGRSVFFLTTATLLPTDRDGGDKDVYVARVGGGFPPESPPAPGCEGEACKGPPAGRIERPSPPTTLTDGRIGVSRIGLEERRRIVASGRITLLVEAPASGRLSARARARIDRRRRTIAAADLDVARAGPVRLQLPLTPEARGNLARGEDLRVRLTLRLVGLEAARTVSFTLEGARPR